MSSVVCGKQCPFGNGFYCNKDIVILTAGGQCVEHWNDNGQPIRMRDPFVENKEDYLKRQSEKVKEKVEECEEKGNNNDTNAENDDGNLTENTEKGAES